MSSAADGASADLGVLDDDAHVDDGGVPHGALLRAFVDAVLETTDPRAAELRHARAELFGAVGPGGLGDAATVVAQFNAITRIADATGTQLDELQASVAPDALEGFDYEALRTE